MNNSKKVTAYGEDDESAQQQDVSVEGLLSNGNKDSDAEVLGNHDRVSISNIQADDVGEQHGDFGLSEEEESEFQLDDGVTDFSHQLNTEKVGSQYRGAVDAYVDKSQLQHISVEGQPSSDNKDSDTEVLGNPNGGSNMRVDDLEGQHGVSEEDESESQQDDGVMDFSHQLNTAKVGSQSEATNVAVQVDKSLQPGASTHFRLSVSDDSSSQISATEVNISVAEEQEDDIPTKLAKQLAVMKIKNILLEKGSISLQILNSILGGKATKEERDAIGWKADQVLLTLTQHKDVFAFESRPECGGNLVNQQYVRAIGGSEEDEMSLALARSILKIQNIIKEKGNVTVLQLSTWLNQKSSKEERSVIGKNPSLLKATLLALPEMFHVSDSEVVFIIKTIQTTSVSAIKPMQPTSESVDKSIQPASESASTSSSSDETTVDKYLGILKIKEILQQKVQISLQVLCCLFGQRGDDIEREAVGRRYMAVLETLKEFPDVFQIHSPKHVNTQNIGDETQISLKTTTNKCPVPYARAIFKLIRALQQKGTLSVVQLSGCLGQNSTPEEREAVGRNPVELKKTLKRYSKIFKVSGEDVGIAEDAKANAAKLLVLTRQEKPQFSISAPLKAAVVSRVTKCLQSMNGSCDVTKLVMTINNQGSSEEKKMFGSGGSALLSLLRTMPNQFRCQGSKVFLVNKSNNMNDPASWAASNVSMIKTCVPQVVNPVPVQGVLPLTQAKVIPSIEIVFDTKKTGGSGWGDISVSKASTTSGSLQGQSYANMVSRNPSPLMAASPQVSTGAIASERVEQFYMDKNAQSLRQSQTTLGGSINQTSPVASNSKTSQPSQAKQSALQKITTYLEQAKIATIMQLGGRLSQFTAEQRKAVGKNPSLLYDTLVSLPENFVVVGPFIGVKSQSALVTAVAKLVSYVESKGKCEVSSLTGRLSHTGTRDEREAIGRDLETFTKTLSNLSGIFIVDGTSVYLNNGMEGRPHAPTPLNKATATNQNVGWTKSAGTCFTNVTQVLSQTKVPVVTQPPAIPNPQTVSKTQGSTQNSQCPNYALTVVSITDEATCQEFVDECLSKYEYPIISLSIRKRQKWIAIAGWEGHVYMFDMEGADVATASPAGFRILADIISSDKILKVGRTLFLLEMKSLFDRETIWRMPS